MIIEIPGKPGAWQRARSNGKVRFNSPAHERGLRTIGQIAASEMAGNPPIEGPVRVEIEARFPWPKSVSAKKRAIPGAQYCASQKDLDNISKLVGDALNNIVWRDDRQVVELRACKVYHDVPSTIIKVDALSTGAA